MKFLYDKPAGRMLLKLLTAPALSRKAGEFLDTRKSLPLIPPFILANHIDMNEVAPKGWESFNDFFTRKLLPGSRTVEADENLMISPCDGLLKAFDIREGSVVTVKDVPYTVRDLLRSGRLADIYEGGLCLVYRLTPSHYHRYIYPESGMKTRQITLSGILHTVRPVATEEVPVFVQNTRSYSVIKSRNFGPIVFMQVGAMLVGRIVTEEAGACRVRRGDEAGRFEYGGSTIVVLVRPGRLELYEDIKKASASDTEYPVRLGQAIGKRLNADLR
ncbi:MAG: phosphatidylserine decarboxylase [Lachnospiraceae bacterium]|nr:phosphatidylserine decarboxylase [Lachnospiraceae bacterium]